MTSCLAAARVVRNAHSGNWGSMKMGGGEVDGEGLRL